MIEQQTEQQTAPGERADRFTANLTAYVLVMRFGDEATHFFRLDRTAPNGCRWVTIPSGEQSAAASFLLNNLRRKRVELSVTGPVTSFRDGEKACRLREVGFGFSDALDEPAEPPQGFFVDRLIAEESGGVERRIFVLDQAKPAQGRDCDRIVFTFENRSQLESAVMQCFLGPRRFDFQIAEELGGGRCTIRSIRLL